MSIKIEKVSEIDTNKVKPTRAGIIFYIKKDDNIMFGLGTDSKSHDLTDFSGSVKYYKNETCIDGALREFKEETLGIFDELTIEDLLNFYAVHDEENMVIFIMINSDMKKIKEAFNNKVKYEKESEICSIFFLESSIFRYFIKNKPRNKNHVLYEKLRRLLYNGKLYDLKNLSTII